MGLLPLEFTDCLQDSPYFRDSLHSHEKELERTSNAIKDLIKEVKGLIQTAKALSASQRRLSQRLVDFKFECIGIRQTDDEIIIASSLKEFGKLIAAIEDERDRMLDRAYEQFIEPLEDFRRKQIGAVKERKKKFEKQTSKFCASQERYLGLSTKKQDTVLQEADATLEMEQRDFIRAGLEYVCLIQEVQERKKFEFVETLLAFMYGWLTFYHQGHEVAKDFNPHMLELQSRIQKTRENFNASRADIHALMRKMLEVRNAKPIDPGTLNKLYTRSGYLFLMEKKALGSSWNKYYCHYQKDGRLFCMIPYNQTAPKVLSNETFRVKACINRISESIDKRFCFDLIPEDKPGVVHTFQALSEEDRELWLDAMDGKEPMFARPPRPSDANQTFLDEAGFVFVTRSIQVLESRGLEEQGLYRVVGVASKVTRLLTMGLDRRKSDRLSLEDALEWESKTITSAVKTFFRNLPEPIMTHRLHFKFIAAAKLDSYEERVNEIHRLVDQLPEPNKRMLELLLGHLEKVSDKCDRNMMTVSNLGVCFGPTLLRAEEETVAAIMDIKFANVVVEILIENWRKFLTEQPISGAKALPRSSSSSNQNNASSSSSPGGGGGANATSKSQLTVLPLSPGRGGGSSYSSSSRLVSPPNRPPPPYQNPPPPPHHPTQPPPNPPGQQGAGPPPSGTVATLAHAVIYNNGPKQALMSPKSSSSSLQQQQQSPPPGSTTSSSSYATWERPQLRQTVPPPLTSAPTSAATDSEAAHLRQMSASMYQQRPTAAGKAARLSSGMSAGSLQNVSGASLSAYEDSGGGAAGGGTSMEYPPLAPRPKVAPRPSASSLQSYITSAKATPASVNSSSSSVDSLTSSAASGVQQHHASVAGVASAPMAAAQKPAAAPRTSLSASSSAPLAAPEQTHKLTSAVAESSPSSSTASSSNNSNSNNNPSNSRTVRTLYACVAEHETELSFEPNQIITSVRPSLEPGWLEGCLDGKLGLIPENYVEYIT